MDFEFNKSETISANGVTPVRTAGDLLIQYDLAQGGTNPQLFVSTWLTTGAGSLCEASNSTPCWSDRINLSASGDATGSINTTAILAADSDGLGDVSVRTFGEAQLDFGALAGGEDGCTSFGSAYLKSRSSDSFTAALKDFIAPTPLDLDNCGKVIIRKETDPDGATDLFGYTHNLDVSPALEDDPGTPGLDESTQFQLADGEMVSYDVLIGDDYTVTEDDLPDGWEFVNVDCSASVGVTVDTSAEPLIAFDIDDPDDVVDCTYNNQALVKIIVVTCSEGDDSVIDSAIDLDDGTAVATVTAAQLEAAGVEDVAAFCAGLTTFGDLAPGTYDMDIEVPDVD
jgi:hypothetical protein